MMRKFIGMALLVLLFFGNFSAVVAQTRPKAKSKSNSAPPPSPQALLLMEASTGQVLYEENPHKKWPPASMVKMALMLIVMERVNEGSLKLSDKVTISAWASKIGGSQVYLKEGEAFSLEQLMEAVSIASANDASTAVAEYVGGSVDGFVQMMNELAKKLKMNDTQYFSVHGLPPEGDQNGDITSAFDSAMLARELLRYPDATRWTSTKEAKFRDGKFILSNTNGLIGNFPGADGLKTGYFSKAGFNVTATANRDNMRLIAVVLGAPTNKARSQQAAKLLSVGFNNYKKLTVLKAGEPSKEEVSVKKAKVKSLRPVAAADAVTIIKRSEENSISLQSNLPESIEAPIAKGQEVGKVIVKLPDRTLAAVSLVAPEEIPKASLLWRIWHWRD